MEIDHGWCTSIYTKDPNGILVEFCTSTRQLGPADHEEALRRLADLRARRGRAAAKDRRSLDRLELAWSRALASVLLALRSRL